MIGEEILKKIRRLEIISRQEARDLFAGDYHSAFKGRGMEFSDVREYQPGDDVRLIDWNVSSRLGRLFVKQFVEERELTVILAIDLSASLAFFSQARSKREVAAEMAALIAFTALLNNDKIGLLIFTDRVEHFIAPRKGRTHLLRIIRDILDFSPAGRGTSLSEALVYLARALNKKSVIFLISDFLDGGDFTRPLKITARKHDLIVVDISDARERRWPDGGLFALRDLETGERRLLDCGLPRVRSVFPAWTARLARSRNDLFRRSGVDTIRIEGEKDTVRPLIEFFLRRRRRRAR